MMIRLLTGQSKINPRSPINPSGCSVHRALDVASPSEKRARNLPLLEEVAEVMFTRNIVKLIGGTFVIVGLLVLATGLALPQARAVSFTVRPFFGFMGASQPIGTGVQFWADTALEVVGGLLLATGSAIVCALFVKRQQR